MSTHHPYEIKIVRRVDGAASSEGASELDQAALDGWRIVAVVPAGVPENSVHIVYLERPVARYA